MPDIQRLSLFYSLFVSHKFDNYTMSYKISKYGAFLGINLVGISGAYCILLRVVLKLKMHDAIPLLTVGIIGAMAGCLYVMRNRKNASRLLKGAKEE